MHTLTIDTAIGIEKVALDTRLDKEPGDWAPEIISAAYRNMPFLKSFEMDAELERVDGSRGYGVGKLLVYPMGMEKDAAIKDGNLVVFPIIVREKNLAPFDVFSHDGQFKPMTKEAVEQVLFRPGVFGAPARKGDIVSSGMGNQIGPPTTGSNRFSGGGGFFKSSSVVEKIAHTIRDDDRREVFQQIGSHPGLRSVYEGTPDLAKSLLLIGQGAEKTASDIRVQRRINTPPDVIQIFEDGSGYLVKHANSRCFRAVEERRSAHEVQDLIGHAKMAELRESGSMVITVDPTTDGPRMEKSAQEANTVGIYQAVSGAVSITGIAVPRMITFDGDLLDCGVFASSDAHAIQKVAGVFVSDLTLPTCRPRGLGVFVAQSGTHGLATEPVDISNEVEIEKVAYYLATRVNTGEKIKLMPTPGLQKIAKMGRGEYAIPESMVFLPLKGKQIEVQEDVHAAGAIDSIKVAMDSGTVTVLSDGTSYSLRGSNVDLLEDTDVLNVREAGFVLGALGVPGDHVSTVLEKVAKERKVMVPGTRRIVPERLAQAVMIKKAAAVIPSVSHLRHNLVREAALLCMPKAHMLYKTASVVIGKENLDAVLSLNFITPENVGVFIEALPDLEKTANKLAEIVIASRMGMDEVRESAACRAMKSLGSVIEGLMEIRDKIQ